MKKKTKKIALSGLAAAAAVAGCLILGGPDPGKVGDPGNIGGQEPTEVTLSADALELPSYTSTATIVNHNAYTASYNRETLIPDWVAYELTSEETQGDLTREGIEFKMDPDLRKGKQAMREDYSNSGWTKGHMMPAADANTQSSTLAETFYFTNICPQDETLNAGDWQFLEKRVRSMARKYGKVWVVTGPLVGRNIYGTIGDRNVTVPDAFFKALLIQKTGGKKGVSPDDGGYSAIAFVMGNDDARYYLKNCAMSVNDLEEMTGIDFFPALPDEVEETVEGTVVLSDWGIKK